MWIESGGNEGRGLAGLGRGVGRCGEEVGEKEKLRLSKVTFFRGMGRQMYGGIIKKKLSVGEREGLCGTGSKKGNILCRVNLLK